MSDTPTPSGNDIESLGLNFHTNADSVEKKIENATETYIKAADAADKFATKQSAGLNKVQQQIAAHTAAFNRDNAALKEAIKVREQMIAAQDAGINKQQAFIVKLGEATSAFGKSKEELLRQKAAMLEVAAAAEPYIRKLEEMRLAAERNTIQQKRDIELYNAKGKAASQAAAQEAREYARLQKQADKYYADRDKAAEKFFAEENKRLERQKAAQIRDAERAFAEENRKQQRLQSIQEKRDTEMHRMRVRAAADNERLLAKKVRDEELAAERAIKAAEREMREKIKWGDLNVRQQVNQLERLERAKRMGASDSLLKGMFGAGAIGAIGDLPGLRKQAEVFDFMNSRSRNASVGVDLLRGSVLNLAAAFSAVEMVQMIDQYTKFTAQLKLATDSAQAYAQAYADVRRISRQGETDLAQTGVLYARIARSTEQLGVSQQRVSDITETVTMALKASGATSKETSSAMLQLSQAFGAGVLRGEEFNAVNEAAPALMQAIADGLGVSRGALKEMSKEGQITAEVLAITIPKALEKMRAEAEQVRTISGAFTVLKNELMQYIGYAADASGFTKGLTTSIKFLADNIDVVVIGVTALTALSLAKWAGLATASIASLTAGLGAARIAATGFFTAMGPIGWLITALGLGATAWSVFGNSSKSEAEKAAAASGTSTKSIIDDLNEQIAKLRERNDLAQNGPGKLPVLIRDEEVRVSRMRSEYQDAANGTGAFAGLPEEARRQRAQTLGIEYGKAYAALQELNKERERGKRIDFEKNKAEVLAQYATNAEKLTKALEDARKKMNVDVLPSDVEKRIRDSFAKKGPKDPAIAAGKKEDNLYASMTADIQAKIEMVRKELEQDEKLTESQKLKIKIQEQLETGAKRLGRARVENIMGMLRELEIEEDRVKVAKARKEWDEMETKLREQKQKDLDKMVEAAEKEAAKNAEIADGLGKTKAAIEAEELARLEAQLSQRISVGLYDAETESIDRLIKAKRNNAKSVDKIEKYELNEKQAKDFQELLNPDLARQFGEALEESFGRAGDALLRLIDGFDEYSKRQSEIDKGREVALTRFITDADTMEQYQENKIKLDKLETKNKLGGYGDMANAAKTFFNEQSAGYKTLDGMAKVFHAAQLAMNLVEMGQMAIKAVLNQADGDPYSAWARMAAMAAVVAGLGFAVGGGFSGGAQQDTRGRRQASQGTGTVFGDAEAKSESIANSISKLAENSDLTMPVSQAMLRSLRGIEEGISGLANAVVRSVGIVSGNGFNIKTGSGGNWLTGYNSSKIVDSGLQIDPGRLRDYMVGGGIKQYAEKESYDSGFLGFGGGYDYDMYVKDADPRVKKEVARVFRSMVDSIAQVSTSFGYSEEGTKDYLANNVTWTKGVLSLRGLKGDELEREMQAFFGSYMDQSAQLAVSGLDDFQKVGEGYFETLVRVANGIEKADSVFEKYGMTAAHYTSVMDKQGDIATELFRRTIRTYEGASSGITDIIMTMEGSIDELDDMYSKLLDVRRLLENVGLSGNVTREMIIGAGGSPDDLENALETYQDKFFSDEEKAAIARKNFQEDMYKIGFSTIPKTREEFRKLADSVDTSSESGQKLLGKLLMLSDDFVDVAEAAEKLSDAWKDITNTLLDEVKRIRGEIGGASSNFAQAQADFSIATAKARAGDQDAAASLPELSRNLLSLAEGTANSAQELAMIRALTAASLEQTAKQTKVFESSVNKDLDPEPYYGPHAASIAKHFGYNVMSSMANRYSTSGVVAKFADGGTHLGGLRIVGEEGPELEVTGPSRILNNSQLSGMLNGELVQEVRALRQEVSRLRQENNSNQTAIARSTEQTHKILKRVDTPNGLLTTDEVPS